MKRILALVFALILVFSGTQSTFAQEIKPNYLRVDLMSCSMDTYYNSDKYYIEYKNNDHDNLYEIIANVYKKDSNELVDQYIEAINISESEIAEIKAYNTKVLKDENYNKDDLKLIRTHFIRDMLIKKGNLKSRIEIDVFPELLLTNDFVEITELPDNAYSLRYSDPKSEDKVHVYNLVSEYPNSDISYDIVGVMEKTIKVPNPIFLLSLDKSLNKKINFWIFREPFAISMFMRLEPKI